MAKKPVPGRKPVWYTLSSARNRAALGVVLSIVIALGNLAARVIRNLK